VKPGTRSIHASARSAPTSKHSRERLAEVSESLVPLEGLRTEIATVADESASFRDTRALLQTALEQLSGGQLPTVAGDTIGAEVDARLEQFRRVLEETAQTIRSDFECSSAPSRTRPSGGTSAWAADRLCRFFEHPPELLQAGVDFGSDRIAGNGRKLASGKLLERVCSNARVSRKLALSSATVAISVRSPSSGTSDSLTSARRRESAFDVGAERADACIDRVPGFTDAALDLGLDGRGDLHRSGQGVDARVQGSRSARGVTDRFGELRDRFP